MKKAFHKWLKQANCTGSFRASELSEWFVNSYLLITISTRVHISAIMNLSLNECFCYDFVEGLFLEKGMPWSMERSTFYVDNNSLATKIHITARFHNSRRPTLKFTFRLLCTLKWWKGQILKIRYYLCLISIILLKFEILLNAYYNCGRSRID